MGEVKYDKKSGKRIKQDYEDTHRSLWDPELHFVGERVEVEETDAGEQGERDTGKNCVDWAASNLPDRDSLETFGCYQK